MGAAACSLAGNIERKKKKKKKKVESIDLITFHNLYLKMFYTICATRQVSNVPAVD
jgi:hypothetical protein